MKAAMVIAMMVALGGMPTCTRAGTDVKPASSATLRQAAGGRFLIGTAVMPHQLDDPKLADLIARQFDCLTGENDFKPESLEPQPGKFRWGPADKIVAFAERHHMKVVGHNLCWHIQTPAWMFQDQDKQPLPREKALANLKNHIDAVAGHFKGKVIGWDVVNEAISDKKDEYLRNSPARKAIGDDYIAKAFEFAHAADPGAALYYNDYSNENLPKREKTIRLIRELKSKGLRIDGVGLQCHFSIKYPDAPDILDEAIGVYAAEGVKVMLTELDVDVLPRAGHGADVTAREKSGVDPWPQALPADAAKAQADFYTRVFKVVLKHPGVVTRVTLWGTYDGTSWLNDYPVKGRHNHPLLWDRDLQPKPAFEAVLQSLGTSTVREEHP